MDQHNFLVKLGEKFQPKDLFTNAKNQMKKATRKYEKQAIYSRVWQRLPVHQRKVLAHFRDKGPTPPVPVNSPRTERRKNIENKFNVYWKSLTKNNRNTVRGYIARHKSASPVSANYFKNINALKTAKARAEWLKAKKLNFKKDELVALKEYVKKKNQADRERRAAKKAR